MSCQSSFRLQTTIEIKFRGDATCYHLLPGLLPLLSFYYPYYHLFSVITTEHSISQLYKSPMKIIFCWIEHPATFIRKLKTLRVLKCNPVLFFCTHNYCHVDVQIFACDIVQLLYRYVTKSFIFNTPGNVQFY
jgi:hypothetical protein